MTIGKVIGLAAIGVALFLAYRWWKKRKASNGSA